ncbi:MAG: aminopeptidase [Clostridiales bacterium]|nr:aminopeptidase [Clostridiales bacterium]
MDQERIRKYAKLAVCTGVNVQPGQTVMIFVSPEQHEFAAMVAEECYLAGAGKVMMEWTFQPVTKMAYQYETVESLGEVPEWLEAKHRWMAEELPCHIHILSDDPDGLAGVDPEKMQQAMVKKNRVLKKYRDARENRDQWTIIAVPSPSWAKKVYPNETEEAAQAKLWEDIFSCVHIEKDKDPVDAWNRHNHQFLERCRKLNEYGFEYLEYKNQLGTDFRVWLIPGAVWMGGGEYTMGGTYYNPNMPTEEIFTTPASGRAEGKVVSSKPLSYQGMLIEDFWVEFKEGKAVSWSARCGEEVLGKIITMDEGSCCLGEVALVPESSPVSQTGHMFYETLFDENASCHLALGAGFSNVLPNYDKMTAEEWKEAGINDSLIHVDFMIGTPDMNIQGVTSDGKRVDIFVNGEWAEEFRSQSDN